MTDRIDQRPTPRRSADADKDSGPATRGRHSADDGAPESLLEQMGGISGMVFSAVPVVVFVLVNSIWSLKPAIWASLGAAVVLLLVQIVRKQSVQPAISGLFGAGIAAFIAWRTGSAKGYFLFGVYTSLLYGGILLVSVLVRWPIVGAVWNFINGHGTKWRRDKLCVRYYDVATLMLMLVFLARFVVQKWLYDSDQVGWLAAAKIGMGAPLWALALLGAVWFIRKADKRLEDVVEDEESDEEIEQRLREKYAASVESDDEPVRHTSTAAADFDRDP